MQAINGSCLQLLSLQLLFCVPLSSACLVSLEEKSWRTPSQEKEQLPLRLCIVMLRASFLLNKVMETPGKRGLRLGQITRKPAKRALLSSQENITETDFLVGFWPFCFWGPTETRKKSKTNQTSSRYILVWKIRMISLEILLDFGSYRPIRTNPTAVIILCPQWNSQLCGFYLRLWSHSLFPPHISQVCPVVGPISVLLDCLVSVVIFTIDC